MVRFLTFLVWVNTRIAGRLAIALGRRLPGPLPTHKPVPVSDADRNQLLIAEMLEELDEKSAQHLQHVNAIGRAATSPEPAHAAIRHLLAALREANELIAKLRSSLREANEQIVKGNAEIERLWKGPRGPTTGE